MGCVWDVQGHYLWGWVDGGLGWRVWVRGVHKGSWWGVCTRGVPKGATDMKWIMCEGGWVWVCAYTWLSKFETKNSAQSTINNSQFSNDWDESKVTASDFYTLWHMQAASQEIWKENESFFLWTVNFGSSSPFPSGRFVLRYSRGNSSSSIMASWFHPFSLM